MKKLFSFLLALAMVLTLCACGGQTPNNTESTGKATDATQNTNQTPASDATETIEATKGTVERPPSRLPEETYEELPFSCEHAFTSADCTTPRACTICGFELEPALGHDFVDGVCTRCDATE